MNSKIIGIIILVITLICTLIAILFYTPSELNTNIELAEPQNIDSIYTTSKRSLSAGDEPSIQRNSDVFVTQSDLDSIAQVDLNKKKKLQNDHIIIDENMTHLNNSASKLERTANNGIEDDTLFKAVTARIKNRDKNVQPQSQESSIDKRRNMLSQSWSNTKADVVTGNNLLPAVIHKTQTIKNNQTVSIRTKQDFTYRNIVIPRNTLIIGVATFNNNRLDINIHNIRLNNQLIAANIVIFGSDGIKGLEVSTDEVKKSIDSDVTDELTSEVTSTLNKAGNQVGRIAGALIGQTMRTINTEKQRQITLIDNQSIYLSVK